MAEPFDLGQLDPLRLLYERSPIGISIVGMDGRFLHANPALCALYGYSLDELRELTVGDLLLAPDESRRLFAQAGAGVVDEFIRETVVYHSDGSPLPIRVITQVVRDEAGAAQFTLSHVEDRRAELQQLHELEQIASTDSLTGIANQRGLEQFIARTPGGHHVAVFEIANYRLVAASTMDTASQAELAFEVIRRLSTTAAESAAAFSPLVARLNYNSYMVGFDASWQHDDVQIAIERARTELADTFVIGGTPTEVRFAIGVASGQRDNAAPTIANAAAAAELSRQSIDGSIVFYHDDLVPPISQRARRSTELTAAIGAGSLRTAIQPIVDIRTHAVIGAEALARWTHPQDGEVSPTVFIPMAEESNALADLTRVVMRDALRFIKTAPAPQARISVNVTSSLIESPEFADSVLELLDDYGLDPSVLCLELTESMVVRALPLAERHVGQLAERGVRWSLDDFGTGYSSLSRLVELPFTEIKIDRRFVAGAPVDRRYRAVVEGAVGLGRSMDLDVVAEGVETLEQARLMRELGVHHAQGFLFGRPQLHVRD